MLTKNQAIRETKELWREIAESGVDKGSFLLSIDGAKWRAKNYLANCPLCEYTTLNCNLCPLFELDHDTTDDDNPCFHLGYNRNDPEWFTTIQSLEEEPEDHDSQVVSDARKKRELIDYTTNCLACSGKGWNHRYVYHNNQHVEVFQEYCNYCNGSGVVNL